ncbi:M48 family metalloprotease [Flammeovirga pacifica]|uniref:Peptidase M48 domain-containing protein n=1 Tax=Flammeovirga pacifica TaxID=915059 RepID=A0A1S1Z1C4_FLAPC|nr:M48 family metalloprotease [Flammeovirga pacifica]OHX67068.1 hypothetical protein NH26_12300 [Flammeovirga pacifica]
MKTIALLLQIIFVFQFSSLIAQNIELDKTLGLEYANQVAQEMGVYQDEEMTEYINCVGQQLVSQLEDKQFNYQFRIVPQVEPNAFALPGGYVFITTGLLSIIQSEDELAGILAHEIIHAHNRHSISQMKKGILPKLLELPGELIGIISKDLGDIFNAPIKASNALYLASYGRKKETEADLEGMDLAARAGYNPVALKAILHRMTDVIELVTGEEEKKSYFSDHPYTPKRESDIETKASFMIHGSTANKKEQYHQAIDGVLFGNSVTQGVFEGSEFMHPELSIKVKFPDKWLLINQPEYFGGYSQDSRKGVVISIEEETEVMEASKKFIEKLSDKEKGHISSKGFFPHREENGYRISFAVKSKAQENYANIGWVKANGRVYRISNFSDDSSLKIFERVSVSLIALGDNDGERIHTQKVAIVKVKAGETLKYLCKRNNNVASLKLIEVLNDLKADDHLKEGQGIKIVKKYAYTSEVKIHHDVKITE